MDEEIKMADILLTTGPDNFVMTPGLLGPSDFLLALEGNDTITGSDDNERINGNAGDDSLIAGGGNDRVYGGQGNDTLVGEAGIDFVSGDGGDDLLAGGPEVDALLGGEGADIFVLQVNPGDPANGDALADYQPATQGDRIQLPEGLTEADLLLTPFEIPLDEAALAILVTNAQELNIDIPPELEGIPLTPAIIRPAIQAFMGVDVDPNGDNIATGTSIAISATGEVLALVANSTPADLAGSFI
jgi:hypothetical protein